jgi:4a-hydroxytetrahydrobiopterin dehydratase
VTVLGPDVVDAALAEGLEWDRDGSEIVKRCSKQDFAGALAYVNAVGELAEAMNHHPDIDIRWNTVTLRLTTHSAGGITEADLKLARRIDALDVDAS